MKCRVLSLILPFLLVLSDGLETEYFTGRNSEGSTLQFFDESGHLRAKFSVQSGFTDFNLISGTAGSE